jgi:hypothetical protein
VRDDLLRHVSLMRERTESFRVGFKGRVQEIAVVKSLGYEIKERYTDSKGRGFDSRLCHSFC